MKLPLNGMKNEIITKTNDWTKAIETSKSQLTSEVRQLNLKMLDEFNKIFTKVMNYGLLWSKERNFP